MLTLDDRLLAVFSHAWRLLPAVKSHAYLTAVGAEDLGARHGSFSLDDGHLVINSRLLGGDTSQSIQLMDINADDPPHVFPCVSRALATALHELWHAIGAGTGLDATPAWLALSGFVLAPDDPQETGRYFEGRPGWPMGFSDWRYATGETWFPRAYASKSPQECFADCGTHLALGWISSFSQAPPSTRANALAKLAYLRREVWGERGVRAIQAAAKRWQAARRPVQTPPPEEDETLEDAIRAINTTQKRQVLAWLPHRRGVPFDEHAAIEALTLAIAPFLLRTYRQRWRSLSDAPPVLIAEQFEAIHRAATSYATTTARQIQDASILPSPQILPQIDRLYDRANTSRTTQLALTETHRMTQAAQQAVWQDSGDVAYKVWRTTSAEPCSFCAALEGMRIPIGEAFFLKGATMQDATGKQRVLDYEDVHHPPLHGHCMCILESE